MAHLRRLRLLAAHTAAAHPPAAATHPTAAGAEAAAKKRRCNLLYIISDQHSPFVTGCYGDQVVDTPNLDGLVG